MADYLQRLLDAVKRHGMEINTNRVVTGTRKAGFRQLEIGCGEHWQRLYKLAHELRQLLPNSVTVLAVNNPEHPDYRRYYLQVDSLWWSEGEED